MYLHKTEPDVIVEGLWWEETCVRRQGGYDLDTTNLPTSLRWFPKGATLAFNSENGKATFVKTAKVTEAAAKSATTVKVEDKGILVVGDKIGGATISAIEVADGVATLTVDATAKALKVGDVIASFDPSKDVLLGLNYATVDLRDNDFPSVTPTLQAYEIEENSLPYPINDEIKAALGDRHQFKIL